MERRLRRLHRSKCVHISCTNASPGKRYWFSVVIKCFCSCYGSVGTEECVWLGTRFCVGVSLCLCVCVWYGLSQKQKSIMVNVFSPKRVSVENCLTNCNPILQDYTRVSISIIWTVDGAVSSTFYLFESISIKKT